jgi:hypothetical protein
MTTTAQFSFDAYKIRYFSHTSIDVKAQIRCYQGTAHTPVGRIDFYSAEPQHPAVFANGKVFLRYRMDRFPDVYQLLLHEKPLWLFFQGPDFATDGDYGAINTAEYEPTGEEEPA